MQQRQFHKMIKSVNRCSRTFEEVTVNKDAVLLLDELCKSKENNMRIGQDAQTRGRCQVSESKRTMSGFLAIQRFLCGLLEGGVHQSQDGFR